MNWELLKETLSPAAFAALQSHLQGGCVEEEETETEEHVEEQQREIQNEGAENKNTQQSSTQKREAPPVNSVFKLQSYWEDRFAEESEYEWLTTWKQVEQFLLPYLHPDQKILIVGCGNSSFSADLYDAGIENIVNIDFSSVVIQKMKELHEIKRPKMEWVVMDMTKMTFPPHSFDIVIDKAAMDALVVDEGDVWDPNDATIESVHAMCQSVTQVLRNESDKNVFLQISFAQPHFRTKYLMGNRWKREYASPYQAQSGHSNLYDWELSHESILTEENQGCLNSFLYVMKRRVEQKE
jgi:hypothetical protein